jgi:hypothetical protein
VVPKFVATVADCGVPAVVTMVAAAPAVLVRLNDAADDTPETVEVTT